MIFSIYNRTGHQLRTIWAAIILLFTICGGFLIFPTRVGSYSLFHYSPVSGSLADDDQTTLQSDLRGMIAIWNGSIASIPEGWALCDGNLMTPNLTDRFVQSIDFRELPGKTGGMFSHNHTYIQIPRHNHNVNDQGHKHYYYSKSFANGPTASVSNPDLSQTFSYDWGDRVKTDETFSYFTINNSGIDGPHSTSNSTAFPPFIRMPYIMKLNDNPLIPAGIIVFWARNITSIPQGWMICNGSAGVLDLTDRLILGTNNESQLGSVGGEITHQHTYESLPKHTHSMFNQGHQHYYYKPRPQLYKVTTTGGTYSTFLYQSSGAVTELSNAGVSIEETGSDSCVSNPADNYPPYMNLVPILKESDSSILPEGSILIWAKDINELPLYTSLCNGLNATPNLYGKFIRTVDLDGEINLTGGISFHSHRYLGIPKHTHQIPSIITHSHNYLKQGSSTDNIVTAISTIYISSTGTNNVLLETELSYSFIQLAYSGDEYCTTETLPLLPPYYRLGFFMADCNLTQIQWEEPDDECSTCNNTINGCSVCLNPLSPELLYAAAGIGGIFFLSIAIIVRKRRK